MGKFCTLFVWLVFLTLPTWSVAEEKISTTNTLSSARETAATGKNLLEKVNKTNEKQAADNPVAPSVSQPIATQTGMPGEIIQNTNGGLSIVVKIPPKNSPDKAQKPLGGEQWLGDKDRGWHFYEVEPAEPEETKDIVEIPIAPVVVEQSNPVDPKKDEEKKEPAPMSVAWLKTNIPIYRDRAIDDPTPVNVAAYHYLQRVMLDKAQTFAQVSESVVNKDPYIDENVRTPIALYGSGANSDIVNAERKKVISELGKEVGLWFFFSSSCKLCETMAPNIELFGKTYGFKILPVSLDGRPLSNGYFKSATLPDNGQAARLGIQTLPALLAVRPPDSFAPLGYGVLSLVEIGNRLLDGARENGWLNKKQNESTMLAQGALIKSDALKEADPSILESPEKMTEYIRSKIKLGAGR